MKHFQPQFHQILMRSVLDEPFSPPSRWLFFFVLTPFKASVHGPRAKVPWGHRVPGREATRQDQGSMDLFKSYRALSSRVQTNEVLAEVLSPKKKNVG